MKALGRWLLLCLLAVLGLQLFFVLRVLSMAWWAPTSTSFERSQIWQIVQREQRLPWRQHRGQRFGLLLHLLQLALRGHWGRGREAI